MEKFVSCSDDKTIKVWKMTRPMLKYPLLTITAHSEAVKSIKKRATEDNNNINIDEEKTRIILFQLLLVD